ncbi:peptidylprolyl isomerase [Sphingomonas sp. 28-63-12]|uniref:peptidylprolyl isomerase n=1 Tax=Sphingomonas sp. 28-63-12 TaxID=1970434 RepID=UPI000BC96B84|nr:MAG: peptidylprolyl isomerase [Sphingomonas sp. 28-63-12]
MHSPPPAPVQTPTAAPPTATQIADAAPLSAWAAIADDDLMLIDFADGKRVAIWLASGFAPVHVANMRRIARAGWWNDASVYRVQDNYVTQWGDATEAKPPAAGIALTPPPEYEWPAAGRSIVLNRYRDAYASVTGFSADGWPLAGDGKQQWLPHCYGMVGVARNLAPDTGTGGDLYTVIGHAPRHLDRNIALVGRVIEGMGALSALPRGTGGGLGLYEDPAQRVPIIRVTIASDLPGAERPHFDYMKPTSPDFARYLEARANRAPPFFTVPAHAVDLCNLPVPVRAAKR